MSVERELARRFIYEAPPRDRQLRPVVRISGLGIGLGVMLILLSFFIIDGFKQEIHAKINGFSGSIRISSPRNVYGQYSQPLTLHDEVAGQIRELCDGARVFTFIDHMALLKTDSAYSGVQLHGVDSLYNRDFYAGYLREGRLPDFSGSDPSGKTLLSRSLADHLGLRVGDEILAYFTRDSGMKVRKLEVAGLFETGFPEYDQHLGVADIRLLRGVTGWEADQVGGVEVHYKGSKETAAAYSRLFDYFANRYANHGEEYTMHTSEEMNRGLLGWLSLLDANVALILVLLIAVAGMTMITGVVVLILQKVNAIATLKALGQRNASLRKVFRYMAVEVLWRGLLWGNIFAIALAMVQKIGKFITLDPSQYYMSYVPIVIDPVTLVLTNLLVTAVIYLLILIPTSIIAGIRPSNTLRFD